MKSLLRAKPAVLGVAFLLIVGLVAGGLGWATYAALSLERQQLEQALQAEQAERLRLALWRLDGRITAILAREESRPFTHYSAVFAPATVLDGLGQCVPAGAVVEPSPLLAAELPPWMLLHFQTDKIGWESPQVLSGTLNTHLRNKTLSLALGNVTAARKRLLAELSRELPARVMLGHARKHASNITLRERVLLARLQAEQSLNPSKANPGYENYREYFYRSGGQTKLAPRYDAQQRTQKDVALLNTASNGAEWFNPYAAALKPATTGKPISQPGPGSGLPLSPTTSPSQSLPPGPVVSNSPAPRNPPPSLPVPQAPVAKDKLVGQPGPSSGLPPPPTASPSQATATGLGVPAGRDQRIPPLVPPVQQAPVVLPRVRSGSEVTVQMSPMVGQWLPTSSGQQRLVVLRLVRVEEKEVCQGIVLDGEKLGELLAEEVQDLFPGARVVPARDPSPDQLQQAMTTLPLLLETEEAEVEEEAGWTPLRVGLSLAWAAALVALLAVGLGGWSLLSLSERRIRFVSAVTHELRTPLTTLQLYLDMLLGGLVQEEDKRTEYLQTLHAETDRLAQLVGNVLDFSRLENHRPKLMCGPVPVAAVLAQVQSAWTMRCAIMGKELLVENSCGAEAVVQTDLGLLQQVVGNLLDNACKYSREAEDKRIWLRARQEEKKIVLEVADRGPGIPAGERRSIFHAFRRGRCADATTGGVGLGLALARRWTYLLGGRLGLDCPAEGGACFRVELP